MLLVDTPQLSLLVTVYAVIHTFNPYQLVLAHPVNTYHLVKTVVLMIYVNTYQEVLLFPGQHLPIVLTYVAGQTV